MPDLSCADLATKAELQELRDQLNALLGEKEEGGTEVLFAASTSPAVVVAAGAATAFHFTKERAKQAVVSVATASTLEQPIWKALKDGTAQWISTSGNGTKTPITALNQVSKATGQNTVAANLATKGTATAGASLAVLANLVSIGATLGLNIATVNVIDSRIEAEARGARLQIDAVNSSMLRLYDKNQGDINAVIRELDENDNIIQANKTAINVANSEIIEAQKINRKLNDNINEANTAIEALVTQNEELVNQINSSNLETQEVIDNLTSQSNDISSQLTQATEVINRQKETIAKQEERILALETKVTKLEDRIRVVELQYIHLREEFFKLKNDLEANTELNNERVSLIEGKIALVQKFVKQNAGGGGGASGVSSAAATQTSLLDLTSKLTGKEPGKVAITSTDIQNNTSTFQDTFESLLTEIGGNGVTTEQLEALRTGIVGDVNTNFSSLLGTSVIPRLDNISSQTTDRRMISNTKTGICESLNGGSCPVTPANPGQVDGLKGLGDKLGNQADKINAGLGLANLKANQSILGIVKNTNEAVRDAKYGLEAVHKFAETAWKATHADKIMNAATLVLAIHNGMMLSNNLLSTVSEATNVTLEALGIRDSTDTPIDIGKAVKDRIKAVLKNVLGAEQLETLTTRIAKANRIYQASINLLDTTKGLFDNAQTIAEIGIEHTGQIGNALREAGAVYEDAYGEMLDKVNPQNAALRRLGQFREKVGDVEEVFSSVSQISGEIVETKDNFEQLKAEKTELLEEIENEKEKQANDKAEEKSKTQVTAEIVKLDFEPDSPAS